MDFYGFNWLKATEPVRGDSFYHSVHKSFSTHLVNLRRTELTLDPLSGFKSETPGLGVQHLNH